MVAACIFSYSLSKIYFKKNFSNFINTTSYEKFYKTRKILGGFASLPFYTLIHIKAPQGVQPYLISSFVWR